MRIEGNFDIAASRDAVYRHITDPGQLIAARALLEQNADPGVEEVQQGMSGNLCRCTGYRKIIDAVRKAAQRLRS